jgi:hypothetical protein
MNDTALDDALRAGARATDDAVAGWDLAGADDALLAGLLGGGVERRAPRRRGRLLAMAASVLVVAAGFTGAAVSGHGPGSAEEAYAAEVMAAADLATRLLVDDPAWRITYVDESAGDLEFRSGGSRITVNVYPLREFDGYVEDRREVGKLEPSRLFGRDAVTVVADGQPQEIFGRLDDKRMVGVSFDAADHDVVLTKLRVVPSRQWLDALPDSVFSGDRRSLAIDEMLDGLPLPPGYDPGPLKLRGLISDRYGLGAAVVKDVGCPWFDRWFDARERGDAAGAAAASTTLRTAGTWPVMREMEAEGDYPEFFEFYARATRDGKTREPDRELTRTRVNNSLGCRI